MKYFTDEVLKYHYRKFDGTFPEIVSKAFKDEGEYYNSIVKPSLPFDFISEYEKNRGFHDFGVKSLFIKKTENKLSHIYLNIELDDLKYCIIYDEIISFDLSKIGTDDKCGRYLGLWNMDEFEILENGIINHEILLMFGNDHRIKMSFRKIGIRHRLLK
jgi:hypothetical protein